LTGAGEDWAARSLADVLVELRLGLLGYFTLFVVASGGPEPAGRGSGAPISNSFVGIMRPPTRAAAGYERRRNVRGAGSAVFAAILLVVAGTLNIIYGFGALDDANVFVNDTRLIFDNLNTLGWVLIILGVVQLTGGFSLMGGGTYGRVIGIVAATIGAIGALLAVGGAYPFWSLGIFAICVIVIHGLIVLGEPERT
jgi:hypothetical protein